MASFDPNRLFLEEDVEDDNFRQNWRVPSTNQYNSNLNQNQMLEIRKREIEERTLMSTERCCVLLHETEEVGVKTAEELARQREQLEKTSGQLDKIDTTIRSSQKHINGLKSFFGSLKNYISGQRDYSARMIHSSSIDKVNESNAISSSMLPIKSNEQQYNEHPTTLLRAENQEKKGKSNVGVNQRIENNLVDMSNSLSRLNLLAIDLNQEIVDSNKLIGKIHDNVENVDLKIGKQNKEMNILLGRK